MIDTAGLSKSEVSRIRSGIDDLTKLSLEDRIDWVRKYIPGAYKNNYKEISETNMKIISQHPINSL